MIHPTWIMAWEASHIKLNFLPATLLGHKKKRIKSETLFHVEHSTQIFLQGKTRKGALKTSCAICWLHIVRFVIVCGIMATRAVILIQGRNHAKREKNGDHVRSLYDCVPYPKGATR